MSDSAKGRVRGPHSEATRKKISESEKGKVVSEETRRKLSEINRGKKQDPEVTEKIRRANTGKKRSPEFCKRLSESTKGWLFSEETRKKLSQSHQGKKQSSETITKRVAKITGQQRSERIKKNCEYCGKEMILLEWQKNRKFCSMSCKGKWQSGNAVGEKSPRWQGGNIIKKCEECGNEFSVERNRKDKARFCSQHCKGIWLSKHEKIPKPPVMIGSNHPQWKGGESIKICEECGKEFSVEYSRRDNARFCSTKCAGIWYSKNLAGEKNPNWRRIPKTCVECGKIFFVKTRRKESGRFCSLKCKGKWQSRNVIGEKNPNWIGGPKDYCEKWNQEFRRRIRAFFGDCCVECGTPQNESLLHCHHVYYDKKACCNINEDGKYFSNLGMKNRPYNFEINGDPNKFVALCKSCHAKSSGWKNRDFWARHYEKIINEFYEGQSYFTKEEFEKIS